MNAWLQQTIESASPVKAHTESHSVTSSEPQNTETPITLSPQQVTHTHTHTQLRWLGLKCGWDWNILGINKVLWIDSIQQDSV